MTNLTAKFEGRLRVKAVVPRGYSLHGPPVNLQSNLYEKFSTLLIFSFTPTRMWGALGRRDSLSPASICGGTAFTGRNPAARMGIRPGWSVDDTGHCP